VGGRGVEGGVGDLVEPGRVFVTLAEVFCFFVVEIWELVVETWELGRVFFRLTADVDLPPAILAMSSNCRWV
jgi:hypothetical protein